MLDNMPRGTICIEDIEIGMTRHLRKVVTDRDIEMFAEVSTDHNPVHLDDDYANDTIFEGRIAHGMLTAGLISAVIGEQLARPWHRISGAIAEILGACAPRRSGHSSSGSGRHRSGRRRVKLDTHCSIDGKKVLAGEATVLAPSRKFD